MARGSCQIVFVFICSEKCQASSLPSMECRVSRSKEKEKTEILRVYSLSLGGLIAIPKMNVAVGTGWRVCWQSLEMRGRKEKKKASPSYSYARREAVGMSRKGPCQKFLQTWETLVHITGFRFHKEITSNYESFSCVKIEFCYVD